MIDVLRRQLAVQKYSLTEVAGQTWIDLEEPSGHAMAVAFLEAGGRLIAISGQQADAGEADLAYHYDLRGKLHIVRLRTTDRSLPSVVSVFPGADWHERELHEKLGIDFTGRGPLTPLLRSGRLWPRETGLVERTDSGETAG